MKKALALPLAAGVRSASAPAVEAFGDRRVPVTLRAAVARLDSVEVVWIQPGSGRSAYSEHLARHGEGVHHLALDVPDMDAAIAAWDELGARVVQSGARGETGRPGSGRFAYAETDAPGGVTIELLWNQP